MYQLTTTERFILVAIQRSNHGLTRTALMHLTAFAPEEVEKAVDTLEAVNFVESVTDENPTYYIPVPLTEAPIFPDYEKRLASFCSVYQQMVEGDTEATTYACCGVVLLSAVLTGSRDAQFLAQLTSLPLGFVMLVLGMMDRQELWWSEQLFNLQKTLHECELNFADIESALHGVKEEFWNICWRPGLGDLLETLRARRQFGNRIDRWLDEEDNSPCPTFMM
jgi:hypothetical protein